MCALVALVVLATTSCRPALADEGDGALQRARHPTPARVPSFGPAWAPEGMEPPPKPGGAFKRAFVRGVAVGLYTRTPGLDHKQMFREIKALGATHVSLVTSWRQEHVRSVSIRPDPVETYSDDEVRAVIREARAAGLKVMLFPILHLHRRRSGEWRGKLEPANRARWWASYEAFVLHYARLAAEEGVIVYSVGSELLSMEHERDRWVSLISRVREQYKGDLIYSSNWDHFHGVTFWDQLDLVGMTGYFELSKEPEPELAELRATWQAALSVIASYSVLTGRPLILTEVGYPSQVGSAAHPWDYTQAKAASPMTQYLAYRAMYEAWLAWAVERPPEEPEHLGVSGVFLWNWNGYGGPEDIHYAPRGKPATAIIRRWYTGR
ncbi:MAG: hypothetical protein CMH57_06085 [Myxococcales bacterium]|nr:hypothetical protein [Myxococcales bacterium]